MLFSEVLWFCNVCGKKHMSPLPRNKFLGAMVCGIDCARELERRSAISILGHKYTEPAEEFHGTEEKT